jgi:hypothetical protein
MKNATDATQTYRSGYTNDSINPTQYHPNTSHAVSMHDMSGTLGYGVGRILREAFDYAYDTWQGWWYPRPSVETITQHRQAAIYRQGLEAIVTQLDAAIENLRKNPRDPVNLERVKRIINDKDYANYFKPAQTEKLRSFQVRLFSRIDEKVQRFKIPHLKEIVQGYLSELQTEITPLAVASTLPLPTGTFSDAETKRSIVPPSTPIPTPTLSASFESFFNLTALNGNNGFVVEGINTKDYLGRSVNTVGDINGDGFADLALGAFTASPAGRSQAGTVYVLFGQGSSWPMRFDLTTLKGSNGFAIDGVHAGDALGVWVSTAGDINGDGVTDLLLGAYGASPGGRNQAGTVYVLFGQGSGWPARFNLTTLSGSNGFAMDGLNVGGYLGVSVSTAGDINGDSKADLVLGAFYASPGGRSSAGIVYVLLGQGSGWPARFDLTTLNGSNGFAINGVNTGDALGVSVNTAGDINDDGLADLVLGALLASPDGRSSAGMVYVIFGKNSVWPSQFDLTTLNGGNGFAVKGFAGDQLGYSVSTAGDINGDGTDDLALGAPAANYGRGGTTYVLFGQASGWLAQFDLTTLSGNNGFVINGINIGDILGSSVSTAGDINGDGKADLLLGAAAASPCGRNQAGTVYVLFGQSSGWPAYFDLRTLKGSNGFVVEGVNVGDMLGNSVSTAGDINGDGITDFIIGAEYISAGKGGAYVIFGKNTIVPAPIPISFIIVGSIIGGAILGGLGYGIYKKCTSKNKPQDVQDGRLSFLQGSINNEYTPLLDKSDVSSSVMVAFPEGNSLDQTTKISVTCHDDIIASGQSAKPQKKIPKPKTNRYEEKSWHFDPQTKAKRIAEDKIYALIEVTDKDKHKVIEFYQHHPVLGYDIASIEVIYNPNMNHKFALYLAELQERDSNSAFVAKWPKGQENMSDPVEPQENIDWRGEIHEQFKTIAESYRDADYPSVNLLPMWHGTKTATVDSIFRTGYANLATTDNGFFGKGIYGAHEAEYSYRVYAKKGGALILNWTACFSAYPVIDGDRGKFMMKNEKKQDVSTANYSNYDAHYVPVVSRNPNNPNEDTYYPTKPNEPHHYTELVVFQSAACLPRYLVQLQPTLPKALPLNASQYPKTFFQPAQEEEKNTSQTEKRNPYQPPVLF